MKKFLSLLTLVALIGTVSFAQNATPTAVDKAIAPANAAAPLAEFETLVMDYGTIEQHSDPYRFFKFTNTGDAPLIISNAKGSCGCTVPTYPKEPILPGETAEIKVRYATDRVGPFTKKVTLTTNEVDNVRVLTIKGKVNAKPKEESVPEGKSGFGG